MLSAPWTWTVIPWTIAIGAAIGVAFIVACARAVIGARRDARAICRVLRLRTDATNSDMLKSIHRINRRMDQQWADLDAARHRLDRVRMAWRALDRIFAEEGEWWILDRAHEDARNAVIAALGLADITPSAPDIGQVWSDPDGGHGAWHVFDRKARADGAVEWKVGEIGGTSARWWSDEDFHRARFMMRATPLDLDARAMRKIRNEEAQAS